MMWILRFMIDAFQWLRVSDEVNDYEHEHCDSEGHDGSFRVDWGWVRQETEQRPALSPLPRGKKRVRLTRNLKTAP